MIEKILLHMLLIPVFLILFLCIFWGVLAYIIIRGLRNNKDKNK